MIVPPTPKDEQARLRALRSCDILDTSPEPLFDDLVGLAQQIARTPIALISLVDDQRQWFKAKRGLDVCETDRSVSFCGHAVAQPDALLWVEDASCDARFADNPLVTGEPNIRFYAGAPLVVDGAAIGTLCVIDQAPRAYSQELADGLRSIASLVLDRILNRRRELRTQSLLNAASDAIICGDFDGRLTLWNRAAEEIFGYAEAEALGQPLSIIVPPEHRAAHETGYRRFVMSGVRRLSGAIEVVAQRKDGSTVEIELTHAVWAEEGRPQVAAIIRDITARKEAEARLIDAKRLAEAADAAKTAFLANVSHELRTPLNGLMGMAALLARTPLSTEQRELTDAIRISGRRLETTLADVLDLTELEVGVLRPRAERFDMGALLDRVAARARGLAADRDVGFELHTAPGALRPRFGDAERIERILTHLLSNAFKFTERGVVSLRIDVEPDEVVALRIADTGCGFDVSDRVKLFGRFQQADDALSRKHDGLGVGLAVVSGLVQALGGELEVASEPGRGAAFTVRLRLPVSDVAEAKVQCGRARAARVLLAEDNAVNRRLIEIILRSAGLDLSSVADGEAAVQAHRAGTFDLILMDMMMPVMDGLRATAEIRRLEAEARRERTPIIMVSANVFDEHIQAAYAAGANAYLTKPIEPASFLGEVLQWMKTSHPPLEARVP